MHQRRLASSNSQIHATRKVIAQPSSRMAASSACRTTETTSLPLQTEPICNSRTSPGRPNCFTARCTANLQKLASTVPSWKSRTVSASGGGGNAGVCRRCNFRTGATSCDPLAAVATSSAGRFEPLRNHAMATEGLLDAQLITTRRRESHALWRRSLRAEPSAGTTSTWHATRPSAGHKKWHSTKGDITRRGWLAGSHDINCGNRWFKRTTQARLMLCGGDTLTFRRPLLKQSLPQSIHRPSKAHH